MNILHSNYFTIFEYGINTGEMYSPNAYKVRLNSRDLKFIKKSINELKQLKLVEDIDNDKILDQLCNDIYIMKSSQGLAYNYQEFYL